MVTVGACGHGGLARHRVDVVDVLTGELRADSAGRLRASALGSCVAVALYDARLRVGGLAHVMLPGAPARGACDDDHRYAEPALRRLIGLLEGLGVGRQALEACIAGGGNVLRDPVDVVCDANVRSVRGALERSGVPLRAWSAGGFERRSLTLELGSGRVLVTVGGSRPWVLWTARRRPAARPHTRRDLGGSEGVT